MLENLTNKITGIFQSLSNKGALTEQDLDLSLREVRVALLEADVALDVSKNFIQKVKEKAIGQKIIENVQPGQMVIKIVSDELKSILGEEVQDLSFQGKPAVYLICGLQGSGKTTSIAKLAFYLKNKQNKRVALCSTDLRRPAAIEQLELLSKNNDITFISSKKNDPLDIAKEALDFCKDHLYEVLIIDTAGRSSADQELLSELKKLYNELQPNENFLVLDALIGQQSLQVVKDFHETAPLSGFILTRLDADPRGGVALTAKFQTGLPIRFFGSGELINDFELFHPERIASRILGMGDVVSFVEKAQEQISEKDAQEMQEQLLQGDFDLNGMLKQFLQVKKLGGLSGIGSFLPGANKIKNMMEKNNLDEKIIDHQIAIIRSMTMQERQEPEILKASRKKRVAEGSGRHVHEVNRLIKQYEQTKKFLKQSQKKGFANKLKGLLGNNMPTL